MSERIDKEHERFESELYKKSEKFIEDVEKHEIDKNVYRDTIETVRKNVEQYSAPKDSVEIDSSTAEKHETRHITKQLKSDTYQATLKHTRTKLKPSQQTFSRFIHRPFIETVSEIGSKTITRPSGILGGAVLSIIGVLIINLIARHIGFAVPNSIYAILFVLGFVVGLLVESIFGILKKPHKNLS